MNRWSMASQERVDSCHSNLQLLFDAVLDVQDCTVLCGHRDAETQREAFRTGHSKLNWPDSKHNAVKRELVARPAMGYEIPCPPSLSNRPESLAIDVAPYPIDWNDRYRFAWFAGIVIGVASRLSIPVVWGGNWDGGDLEWQPFDDLVHFELV